MINPKPRATDNAVHGMYAYIVNTPDTASMYTYWSTQTQMKNKQQVTKYILIACTYHGLHAVHGGDGEGCGCTAEDKGRMKEKG